MAQDRTLILAGDVGGTKTRIALYATASASFRPLCEEEYKSSEHAGLEEIVRDFRARHDEPITCAGFGVAGPVRDGRCEATNLPWIVDSAKLADVLALQCTRLLNDLEATAFGIATLGPADLLCLNAGDVRASGNRAVIAAGTGLGEAGLFWNGVDHVPMASEGGHADFAPQDELCIELLRFLWREFGRVSWERVLSGPGLVNVYRFLRHERGGTEPAWLALEMAEGDAAAAVSRAGLTKRDAVCAEALELFVSLYGAQAGNLALTVMATGGVFVAGGIAPKIKPMFAASTFMQAFLNKGRLSPLMKTIPVHVVLYDRVALAGAARSALAPAANSERTGRKPARRN